MKHILIANRWRTPDGTLLESKHVHDYVDHQDANGEYYFIDGGHDYIRMSKNVIPMKNECVYADDDWETVRRAELRGAVTKKFDVYMVPLYKMSDRHVLNCITYNLRHVYEIEHYEVHTHLHIKEMLYRITKDLYLEEIEYNKKTLAKEPVYESMQMKSKPVEEKDLTEDLDEMKEIINEAAMYRQTTHTNTVFFILKKLNAIYENLANRKEEEDALMG